MFPLALTLCAKILIFFDKGIAFDGWKYRGVCFCLSMDILHLKAGAGDAIGKGRWNGGRPFEKSAHLLVESPVKKAFLSTIQADHSCTPLFHDAL